MYRLGPASKNGYGLSVQETEDEHVAFEGAMTLLPDTEEVYRVWRRLVVRHSVRGIQVHDARLAAAMMTYGIRRLVTLNEPDFLRYSSLVMVNPARRTQF